MRESEELAQNGLPRTLLCRAGVVARPLKPTVFYRALDVGELVVERRQRERHALLHQAAKKMGQPHEKIERVNGSRVFFQKKKK
jgi:hypothetical protein